MNNETSLATRFKQSGLLMEVAPDVLCQRLLMVNVFYVGMPGAGDRGWMLVDAGLVGYADTIKRTAEERFGVGARPAAIILTHGHFDHVGALKQLAEEWDVPVYAHRLEMPYITGRSSYPPPDPSVGGGAMALLSPLYPKKPIDIKERARTLPEDATTPEIAGWRWLHTPGHTAGHVSFFRDTDRLLIAGDAVITVKQESALAVLTQRQEVHSPPAYFTSDWQAAARSVRLIAELKPSTIATGHGVPMSGDEMREELEILARDFERIGVPAHGRYVEQPAVTNEIGVVSLPPVVSNPLPKVLAGVGLAALVGGLLIAATRRSDGKRQGVRRYIKRRRGSR